MLVSLTVTKHLSISNIVTTLFQIETKIIFCYDHAYKIKLKNYHNLKSLKNTLIIIEY